MAKGDRIARLPTYNADDEWCSICGDDNIVVVLDVKRAHGAIDIAMDSIVFCSSCFGQMKKEIDDLGI